MCRIVLLTLLLKFATAINFLSDVEAGEVVDFTALSTMEASEITLGLLTIKSSSMVRIEKFNGLGVVGGLSDKKIDPGENITLSFTNPVSNLKTYKACLANDTNNDGIDLKLRLEAYDARNQLLRRTETSAINCEIKYSEVLGVTAISRLVITMLSDSLTIGGFSFDAVGLSKTQRIKAEVFPPFRSSRG